MEFNRNKTFLTIQSIINLLFLKNDCNNLTKEECDNCPYHDLCGFVLNIQDKILFE